MKSRRFALKMPKFALLYCLLLLMMSRRFDAACPSMCSCSDSFREVDCSWRGLRHLPNSLQLNIHSLNLSHNRLSDLDHVLAPFTHLRTLDISHNRFSRMPALLPRSLWYVHASNNRMRLLEKNDTAYHWNLRLLDLSANKLERIVFINNTLPDLRGLNLSCNKFWTVPTNMPRNVEMVDLSHNTLVQILPGSLDRLPQLVHFYLHSNRFTTVCDDAFGRLYRLKLITLGDNPWACDDPINIKYLLDWARRTLARVLGCPCHTWPICGQAQLARTTGWHFASYTVSPYATAINRSSGLTRHWSRESAKVSSHQEDKKEANWHGFLFTSTSTSLSDPNGHAPTDASTSQDIVTTTEIFTSTTRRTTTLRTRSVKRPNQRLDRNTSPEYTSVRAVFPVSLSVVLLINHYVM